MKFQLFIKATLLKNKDFLKLKTLRCCLYAAYKINVNKSQSLELAKIVSTTNQEGTCPVETEKGLDEGWGPTIANR